MIVYAIRQISTGLYLPAERNGKGRSRGFSHDVPSKGMPRLHTTARRANAALRAWLEGEWVNVYTSYEGDSLGPCPLRVIGRDKNDMEVVPMILSRQQPRY